MKQIFGFILLFLLLVGCTQNVPGTMPFIQIAKEQTLYNNSILVNRIVLDQPGFVVIHRTNQENTAGEIIGNSSLLNNEQFGIRIPVTGSMITQTENLIAILHYDNGDNEYTALDETNTVKASNQTVQQSFRVIVQAKPGNDTMTPATEPDYPTDSQIPQ